MFSHIMVGANDIEESKIFYDSVLGVLGAKPGLMVPNLTGQTRYFYFLEGMTFCISEPIDGEPASRQRLNYRIQYRRRSSRRQMACSWP